MMIRSNSCFPPLNWTFRSRGYINSDLSGEDKDIVTPLFALTINVITKDKAEVESAYPTVYPCSPDFELDN